MGWDIHLNVCLCACVCWCVREWECVCAIENLYKHKHACIKRKRAKRSVTHRDTGRQLARQTYTRVWHANSMPAQSVSKFVAVCCSVLRCVAVCCNAFKCATVHIEDITLGGVTYTEDGPR